MKKIALIILLFILSKFSIAQNNNFEGLSRLFTQTAINGSARMQGIGGNHTAIGAELSNVSGNPAGIGQYNHSQFIISPSFDNISNAASFIDSRSNISKNNFNIANIGLVLTSGKKKSVGAWKSNWALAYTRENTFYKNITFRGTNNQNNLLNKYAEDVNQGIDARKSSSENINNFIDELNDFPDFQSKEAAQFWSFLVTPNEENGVLGVVKSENSTSTEQRFSYESTGKASQFSISYGGSKNEKIFFGFTLGFPSLKYNSTIKFSEFYSGNTAINNMTETKEYAASAGGLNLTIGAIFKPTEAIRFGLSLQSGSVYDMDEILNSNIEVNVDPNKNGIAIVDPRIENSTNKLRALGYGVAQKNNINYINKVPKIHLKEAANNFQFCTPYKANFGVALFLGKKGFVSTDVQYIGYSNISFHAKDNDDNYDEVLAYELDDATDFNKQFFKNVFNYKIGAEYKFGSVITRLGFNYQEDPLAKVQKINQSTQSFTMGLGYRNTKFFADVAGIYTEGNTFYAPYKLDFAPTPSAVINQKNYRAVTTVGLFF